jgi:hypothetical protein
MREPHTRALLVLSVLAAIAVAIPVRAEPDCSTPGQLWSGTTPPVNERHIFCGVARGERVEGYHSTRVLPSDAVRAIARRHPLADGIYEARVIFTDGKSKSSTFFPDACTVDQIVASVSYAATHRTGAAVPWGVFGPSAPAEGGTGYCLDAKNRPFRIRLGIEDDRVVTAFPAP